MPFGLSSSAGPLTLSRSVVAVFSRPFYQHRRYTNMVMRPGSSLAPDSVAREAAASIHPPRDPNTLSNYNAWRTKHTTADLVIDFDAKRLKGVVHLTLESLAKDESKIILDTR